MVKLTSVLVALVAVVAPVYAAPPPPNGNVYWHTCGNCKCPASGDRTNFSGSTGCMQIANNIRALGLTRSGTKQTTCSVFSDENCQNEVQSMGVASGTYACTAMNQNPGSIKCYYNV